MENFNEFFRLPPKIEGLSEETKETGQRFSIATFNTLADSYAYYHPCDGRYLNFDYRKSKLSLILDSFNTDFICLQEIDRYNDFFNEKLSSIGYESYYLKRPSPTHIDGSLIAWKSDSWVKICEANINFDEINIEVTEESVYKRHNIGIIAVFKNISTEKIIIIGTAHFYWDPNYEYVKFLQAKMYLEAAYNVQLKFNAKIVLTGDLNSEKNGLVINYILGKELKFDSDNFIEFKMKNMYRELPLKMKHCFENYNENGYPDFSNFTESYKGFIDHILYSDGLRLLNLGKLPAEKDFEGIAGIPNQNFPSDHLPLLAEFEIN